MREGQLRRAVEPAAPADVGWRRAVTVEGIADELAPWLRMTFPSRLKATGTVTWLSRLSW